MIIIILLYSVIQVESRTDSLIYSNCLSLSDSDMTCICVYMSTRINLQHVFRNVHAIMTLYHATHGLMHDASPVVNGCVVQCCACAKRLADVVAKYYNEGS